MRFTSKRQRMRLFFGGENENVVEELNEQSLQSTATDIIKGSISVRSASPVGRNVGLGNG